MQSEEPAIAEEHSPAEARSANWRSESGNWNCRAAVPGALESAPDAIVIVDSAGRIAIVNIQTENRLRLLERRTGRPIDRDPGARTVAASTAITARPTWRTRTPARWALAWSCSDCGAMAASFRPRSAPAPLVGGSLLVFCAIRDVPQLRCPRQCFTNAMQLAAAQQIQKHCCRSDRPDVPGIDVLGCPIPRSLPPEIILTIFMPDDALAVVIGDVSGHGFGPALIMASVHTLIRALSQRSCDVCDILQHTKFRAKKRPTISSRPSCSPGSTPDRSGSNTLRRAPAGLRLQPPGASRSGSRARESRWASIPTRSRRSARRSTWRTETWFSC